MAATALKTFVLAAAITGAAACHRDEPRSLPPIPVEQIRHAAVVVPTPLALLVVGSTPIAGGDLALSNRLSTNLGYSVTVLTGSATTSADAVGKALVVI